jgi:tight adherence protein C
MPNLLLVAADIMVFLLMVATVLLVARELENRLGLRRRLSAGTTEVASVVRPSLVRTEGVSNPFLKWVQGASLNDPRERQGLRRDLFKAGFDSPAAPAIYVVIRFLMAVGMPIGFVISQRLSAKPMIGFQLTMTVLILCVVGFIAPRFFVNGRITDFNTALENEFPDTLDLLVVCTEAGLPFEAAFIRVGNDTHESHPHMSKQLMAVTQELRAGRTRVEALRGLADRTDLDMIRSLVALLIQTDALGGSVAQSLRTYATEMRGHRMLRAEEKAMRIPILLTIPLVLCILPVLMVAILLPAVISIIREFQPVVSR